MHKCVPGEIFSLYHFLLTALSAFLTGFPAKKLTVILVTGTKGKSTVSELVYTILKESGHKTVLLSTIKFALPEETLQNTLKMTMPGRGQIQRLLARGVRQGATHAVIESSSEGTLQYRHTFLFPNVLVFTNLQKEHIEAHGSFEKYKAAKLRIARELTRSPKEKKAIVAHADDPHADDFLKSAETKIPFSQSELTDLEMLPRGIAFSYKGVRVSLRLAGAFNARNALSALKVAEFLAIPLPEAVRALESVASVRGRVEFIDEGQPFAVVVDYAHTPDSLTALYEAFPDKEKICVLGNTGGGRDTWKRPRMGEIADAQCARVILTNEDPYDEDPQKILDEMAVDMKRAPHIIMDRRSAIADALTHASPDSIVLISGKGTDPYLMEAGGKKTPWDDAQVVREELAKLPKKNL